jgi:hypothetical protein
MKGKQDNRLVVASAEQMEHIYIVLVEHMSYGNALPVKCHLERNIKIGGAPPAEMFHMFHFLVV